MARMQKTITIAGIFLLVMQVNGQVEPETLKTVYQMPPIIVIGERIKVEPVSRSLISKETIKKLKNDEVSALLAESYGVSVQDYGNPGSLKSAIIRTTGSSTRSLVLLNGRPANDPYNGGFNFSLIQPNLLDGIALYRGPFSHLFGRDALGGVIALTSKSLTTGKPYSKVEVSRGSFESNRFQLDFGRSLIRNTSFYLASDIFMTEGYRDTSATRLYDFSGNVNAKLAENFNVRWDLLFHQDSTQSPGPEGPMPWLGVQKDKRWDGDMVIQLPGLAQAIAYSTSSRMDYKDLSFGTEDWYRYNTYGMVLSKGFRFGYHETDLGLDLQKTDAQSSPIPQKSFVEGGGLIKHTFNRYPFIVAGAVRLDRSHTQEVVLNPSLKLGYQLGGALLYAGGGRSFRAPTINELYWPPSWGYRGNPKLKSESGITYELGAKVKKAWLNLETALFSTRYKNFITTGTDSEGYLTPLNLLSQKTYGGEGSVELNPLPWLKVSVSYSRFWADTTLPHTPDYRSVLALEYNQPLIKEKIKIFLRLEGELAGKRWDPLLAKELDAYQVYNLLASVKVLGITIYSRLNNLLDKKYQVIGGYPMPPREYKLGFSWEFWN